MAIYEKVKKNFKIFKPYGMFDFSKKLRLKK
jgi:hypothetical protein